MLKRKIQSYLEDYLKSDSNKMLIVAGARQVGKSYIIRHVGKQLFPNFVEINMAEDSYGQRIFANAKTLEDFYLNLSTVAGNQLKDKHNTLVFIDEKGRAKMDIALARGKKLFDKRSGKRGMGRHDETAPFA